MAGFLANPVDSPDNVPIAAVYPPGSTGALVALQGSTTTTTDAAGNKSAPANFNIVQYNSVAGQFDGASANIPAASLYGKHTSAGDTPFLLDSAGRPLVSLAQIGGITTQMAGTDGVTSANILEIVSGLYNGVTTDQQRGNLDNIILLTSAAITSNSNSSDQTNYNARGVKVYIKTGSFGSGESTMTVSIQIKDPVSGQYSTVLTSASLSASSFVVLTVYPGATASANVAISDAIPRTWRVGWAASAWGTGGSTLGIACAYIV